MAGHHHHHHDHHGGHLKTALALTALFAAVELIGGLIAGSLALLADAAHMFSDVVALAIASVAAHIAGRPAHKGMTYGYGRAKIIAAQINGLALCFMAGWIVWEAVGRLLEPPEVDGSVMLAVALVGLIVNLIVLGWLRAGKEVDADINVRAAYWHVLGDTLGSLAALVGGAVILTTGWMLIDPLLSFGVSFLLAWGGWRLIRQTTFELMEAVPEGIEIDAICAEASSIEGVRELHHLHVWKLPSGQLALSAHVSCDSLNDWNKLSARLQECAAAFDITHATFQPETGECGQNHPDCH